MDVIAALGQTKVEDWSEEIIKYNTEFSAVKK